LWLPALLSHCCICRVGGTLLLLYFCFLCLLLWL
jgi:hypothetical protein